MNGLNKLKTRLRPGRVYRREDLARWSSSVDRHLQALVKEGVLVKLRRGLYLRPKQSVFGPAPAEEHELVRSFLKTDEFLLTSPTNYNALGVGLTQLHNKRVVYNHKRHGIFKLGNRTFDFRVKPKFPKALTLEFLLIDLANNLSEAGEDTLNLKIRVKEKARSFDMRKLRKATEHYGNAASKKYFASEVFNADC